MRCNQLFDFCFIYKFENGQSHQTGKNWIQLILTRPLTVISSLDAKAWMSITMTPTSAVLISLGLHSVLLSSFSHQSSSYMPTISHWNLEPYMPFLKASQNMTRAHVSLKLPKIIRVSFCLRISNWSLISSLKPAWKIMRLANVQKERPCLAQRYEPVQPGWAKAPIDERRKERSLIELLCEATTVKLLSSSFWFSSSETRLLWA